MWEAIRANKRRSVFLITGLAVLLIVLGYGIALAIDPRAGPIGAVVALFVWLVLWLTAMMSGRQVLLGSMHAREIQHDDYPVLFNVVEEMTIAAGLPKMPKVYIIDSDAPNAFAVGSEDNAAVAVTSGLLIRLTRDELQGVIAHEIGHVRNHDTRFMTLAGVMVAAIVLIADVFLRSMFYSGRGSRRSRGKGGGGGALILIVVAIVLAILAPLVAQVLYFACSRRREYLADASAASFTRYPAGLASALDKISGASGKMERVNRAVAPMFTVNPLNALGGNGLFSTHPPTKERVRVLRSMAGNAGYAEYEAAYEKVLGGASLIGQQTLAGAEPVAVRQASAEPEKGDLDRARDAVDILHRLNGMLFLTCACGLSIKVPPTYKQSEVHCPRCSRTIPIPVAAMAGAAAALDAAEQADAAEKPKEAPAPRKPAVIRHTPGMWQSFRCSCGRTVQLSPSFSATHMTCPSCGRPIQIERG